MPKLKFSSLIPANIERVYEHVTVFPVSGTADQKALEDKYGSLLKRNDNSFIFQENTGARVKWQCAFQPPRLRTMRALDSSWSDRTDEFEPASGGTVWTITWEPKGRGLAAYTQWLAFQFKHKQQVYGMIVLPVLQHFQRDERRRTKDEQSK
jgi:hypothetical protein